MASSSAAKYRGATVEDLDLPPALSISPSTPISTALAMAHDRDYSQLTVTSSTTRALLGYLSVPKIESLLRSPSASDIKLSDPVSKVMNRFDRKKGNVYKVITPDTALEELEEFLKKEEFAVVTDDGRRFVLGVATRGDLEEFTKRRPA
ncbi:hypothetical protein B9Z19DRAFT_1127379 [Tuber borchii]|uniref:CBS domain-containing protein n=1 Tax=Tuber borchii TaxID=42251 RepID=A0A2T6ZRE4_TUBBO|nr:hypothetical protein B9Z19DRAFT_1127379 [Tuber borchii]